MGEEYTMLPGQSPGQIEAIACEYQKEREREWRRLAVVREAIRLRRVERSCFQRVAQWMGGQMVRGGLWLQQQAQRPTHSQAMELPARQ
jgi:hypothetical protein